MDRGWNEKRREPTRLASIRGNRWNKPTQHARCPTHVQRMEVETHQHQPGPAAWCERPAPMLSAGYLPRLQQMCTWVAVTGSPSCEGPYTAMFSASSTYARPPAHEHQAEWSVWVSTGKPPSRGRPAHWWLGCARASHGLMLGGQHQPAPSPPTSHSLARLSSQAHRTHLAR